MRASRVLRAPTAESAAYLPLRPAGASSRANPLRRMNVRLRYALLFSLAIAVTVLFVNLIFIRSDRPSDALRAFGKAMQSDEYYHMEPEDAILDRLRHGYHRPVKLPQKLVHLDLKGAPLNINYLHQVMPLLRSLGATGLLVEYEDMFPYSGILKNISATNCYSEDDIKSFLRAAKDNGLSIIPLVQTFGHLEAVLKLEEFAKLREVPHNPQALCPSRNASNQLVYQMLKQIAELHQDYITHIHIGSDEVYALGECNLCQTRMEEHNWFKNDLFMNHVTSVVGMVHSLGLQAIIWDDMFRNVEEDALKTSSLVKLVEIMIWNYSKNVNLVGVFGKYVTAGFRGLWIASAFKGALSPVNQLPEFKLHILNHHSWVQLLKQFEDKVQVNGIAITGWQRFDHFGTLCELFPVGIPVLAVCLAYLETGKLDDQVLGDVKKTLKCNKNPFANGDVMLSGPPSFSNVMPLYCDYPGSQILADILRWDTMRQHEKELVNTNYITGWMSPMNRRFDFSSPEHVLQGTRDLPDLIAQLSKFEYDFAEDLQVVSDKATADEWVETFVEPTKKSLQSLLKDAQRIVERKYWPRRPILANHQSSK